MKHPTRLISWNVNGIRAVSREGKFLSWMKKEDADIICLQEIKATPEVLEQELVRPLGYQGYWHPAHKPGYSGVSIFSRQEPLSIQHGIGDPTIDSEGRVLIAEFSKFTLINAYFPNSQREHARLGYKLKFCAKMLELCEGFRSAGKNIILCGDFNIAHQEIDLANPKTNHKNAGFLPEERAWMTHFLSQGYVDTFRLFTSSDGHYTWWSYRPGLRQKNIGWRLDYQVVNHEFRDQVVRTIHHPTVTGSDHCPVEIEIKQ